MSPIYLPGIIVGFLIVAAALGHAALLRRRLWKSVEKQKKERRMKEKYKQQYWAEQNENDELRIRMADMFKRI